MQIHQQNEIEIQKAIAEMRKLNQETALLSKKIKWYEFTLALAVIGATVAITKLFL